MFGLTPQELKVLKSLNTPIKIQNYLDHLPFNFEKKEPTHYSPRFVLINKKAHCIEGALLAAAALWVHGEPPVIMDLTAKPHDDDHVVALYRRGGYWGAISKTNHATIRFRDPVYKSPRELALSYFHEWFMNWGKHAGEKTLVSYCRPLNLSSLGESWVTTYEPLWYLDDKLNAQPHYKLVPRGNEKFIRRADPMELKAGRFVEWKK